MKQDQKQVSYIFERCIVLSLSSLADLVTQSLLAERLCPLISTEEVSSWGYGCVCAWHQLKEPSQIFG